MKRIGLYFGTFNPIHIGHLIIASYMAEFSDLEEVWFVITPRSPFKTKETLLADNHRYQMVYEAVKNFPKLKPSTVEFDLPQPNYTIQTLAYLSERQSSEIDFSLIMGGDNLKGLHKWKNYEEILRNYHIYVYPRISEGADEERFKTHPMIHHIDAPVIEISSSFIRRQHSAGRDIRAMVPEGVWKYMDEMNFYR